jgi:hypothetical protein
LNPKLFGIFLKIFKYHACLLIFWQIGNV